MASELEDLVTPSTLRILSVGKDEHLVRGGLDEELFVAVFATKRAAEHWVRYCVENQLTFAGVRP